MTEERSLIKDLWSPGAQVFWPNGPEDRMSLPHRVRPTRQILGWRQSIDIHVKFAWALATGSRISAGENKRKLELAHADEGPLARDISKRQPKLKSSHRKEKACLKAETHFERQGSGQLT